jgi:cysteine dioxygenase
VKAIDVQQFAARLRCCNENDFTDVALIRQILRENPVDPESIERYLVWDCQHYTRNLIDKTPLFELMAICWEVGQGSSIHNHKDQNCWMAAPVGRLLVQNYRVVLQDLAAGTCDLLPTDIVEMNATTPCAVDPAEPVHRVYNPTEFNQRAVSLHVYSRPYDSCVVYDDQKHKCGEIKLSYTSEYGLAHK